jgi:hypothetical protein
MLTGGLVGECGLTMLVRTTGERVSIGSLDVVTEIRGPALELSSLNETDFAAEDEPLVLYLNPLTQTVTKGTASGQIAYSSGVMDPIALVTDTPQQFFIAFGDASPVTGVGAPSEIVETGFSWTAPRDGNLRHLNVMVVASLTADLPDPTLNVTMDFIIRRAGFDTFFSDTLITAHIDIPAIDQSEQRYHAIDHSQPIDLFQSDRVSLQVKVNSFSTQPVSLTVGISAGILT